MHDLRGFFLLALLTLEMTPVSVLRCARAFRSTHRPAERLLVRAKEQGEHAVARLVARSGEEMRWGPEEGADELRKRDPRGPGGKSANGTD